MARVGWKLPEGNRIDSGEPSLYSGHIYGQVDNGKSVAINVQTGKDEPTPIESQVLDVNAFGALIARGDRVQFVRPTG